MSISVNKEICIGCGTCAALSPTIFAINESDGKAEAISQDDLEGGRTAAESCPVQAISVS